MVTERYAKGKFLAVDESSRDIVSTLFASSSSSSAVADRTIFTNMEETSANLATDDQNVSNNVQSENKSNASENEGKKAVDITSSGSAVESAKPIDSKSPTPNNPNEQKPIKKKAVLLNAPNVETICDDITSTTANIKRLKHVHVRSNSTGKLYQSSRRVSFPENDSELVTGYLEPADPWACG